MVPHLYQQYAYIHMQPAEIIVSANIQSNVTKFQLRYCSFKFGPTYTKYEMENTNLAKIVAAMNICHHR